MLEKKYPWQLTAEEIPYYEEAVRLASEMDEEYFRFMVPVEGETTPLIQDLEQAINLVSSCILSDQMHLWTWNDKENKSVCVWITKVVEHLNGYKTLSIDGLAGKNFFKFTNQAAEDMLIAAREMGCFAVVTYVSESRYEAFCRHGLPHRPIARYVSLEPFYTSD